jgi:hypothetical protein
MIELGMTAKDKITGFTGVVTGVCFYLSGCNQALVVPPVSKDGSFKDGQWFDFQRLEIKDKKKITLDNREKPGFDVAPLRRS